MLNLNDYISISEELVTGGKNLELDQVLVTLNKDNVKDEYIFDQEGNIAPTGGCIGQRDDSGFNLIEFSDQLESNDVHDLNHLLKPISIVYVDHGILVNTDQPYHVIDKDGNKRTFLVNTNLEIVEG